MDSLFCQERQRKAPFYEASADGLSSGVEIGDPESQGAAPTLRSFVAAHSELCYNDGLAVGK
jgi:hypothetical protein